VPELAPLARAAVGRELVGVERLAGGSKKGVYRLALDGGDTVVAYVWSAAEDFWPAAAGPADDVFADASGLDLFLAAYDRLTAAGVRTPRLLWADASGAAYPADVAVVEDVRGGTLEDLLDRAGGQAELAALREVLAAMLAATDTRIGKVARPDNSGRSCERIVLDRALRQLDEAAARVPRLADARTALAGVLRDAAGVEPRTRHGLVHGELGPDHVLLDDAGRPVLVDIEGLTTFDAEWEHAFLEIRFGGHYDALRLPGLDPARLRFYRLAHHLSLVAGPFRLLDGDFPDRDFMLEIAATHTERALAYLS
jgi:Phosphotransferase enzyme family